MNRAEMRRKAREQEKCRLPLNFKMQLGQAENLVNTTRILAERRKIRK